MTKQDLHQYCLEMMGITQWQSRATQLTCEYLILMDLPLDASTQALLDKIITALNWPKEKTCIKYLTKIETLPEQQSKKILIFGEQLGKLLSEHFNLNQTAVVPSLSIINTDPQAKKTAWQLMQTVKSPLSSH
jgi:DNA polymerase III psi subunit